MTFNGGDSADNQVFDDASFITTSGILDPAIYPQFESWVAAKYDRPGGPFDPHSGTRYAYSQIADQTFKRLTHTVNVPAGGADMSFWTSYNTEFDWDHVFVEAHTVGPEDWTTLEDLNGHNDQTTGESCKPENGPGGWRTIHPFMDHYQTIVGARLCASRHDRHLECVERKLRRLGAVARRSLRGRRASRSKCRSAT